MKIYTGMFQPRSGTGDQTVTGIVDSDGNPFTPEWVLFNSNYTANNTLGTLADDAFGWSAGIDNGTDGGSSSGATISQFGAKIGSGAGATRYSLLDLYANAFFGGAIQRKAYVSAFGSGEFTLTYDQNDRTGDAVVFHAFASTGDDLVLDWESGWGASGRVPASGDFAQPPQGVLGWPATALSSTKYAATAAGTAAWFLGWATRSDGNYGLSVINSFSQNTTCSYQKTDSSYSHLNNPTIGATSQGPTISAWDATSWTAVAGDIAAQGVSLVFGGPNLKCASGSFTQQATTGVQVVPLGIDAKWVVLQTVGQPTFTDTTAVSGECELSVGFTDGTRQSNLWTGESGTSPTVNGNRYTSNTTILRIAGAGINGASTTFGSVAEFVSLVDGELSIDWTATDAGGAEIIWFAVGNALPDAPGSLTVRKVTVGPVSVSGTTFDFTTTGGLAPETFSLADGESQYFGELPAGLYGVTETALDDWDVVYTVSNDSGHTAITVNSGEDVTLTVQNTYTVPLPDTPPWKLYRFDIKPRSETRS